MECSYKIALIEKIIRKKKFADTVLLFMSQSTHCQNLGESDKFPLSFTFLQCPLEVKKLIRESSTKYVNHTGNFYFRPKLKTAIALLIFNLF